MQHDYSDYVQSKFMEGLPLMRLMTGSNRNRDVERKWMESALRGRGPDGLVYIPVRGRPWARIGTGLQGASSGDQLLIPFYNGRLLDVYTLFARRDSSPLWRQIVRGLVDGLSELAVDEGRIAYFWPSYGAAEKHRPAQVEMPTHWINCENRAVPLGLMYAYHLTGYEPALVLAKKILTYLREQFFAPDASFIANLRHEGMVHFHAHSATLLAMLEYAQVTEDDELKEFVLSGYRYARANGEALTGYFPEFLQSHELEHSEICEVADMVTLALKLSEFGLGDFWDDADRWLRNMFVEGQLTRTDWIDHVTDGQPSSALDRSYQTIERVAERNLGAFAGWPKVNDWYANHGAGIMHCCTGNAVRTLYQAWERIVSNENGLLTVNLLLNRGSPWADVASHLPYRGQVDVAVKQPIELRLRLPEWTDPDAATVTVDGVARGFVARGRLLDLGAVRPGQAVTVSFPIDERTETIDVEKERYTIVRRGNDVVAIDPAGTNCPLFQRGHVRQSETRWRKIERFVSSERVPW
jgi:hypothetical protein